MQSHTILPLTAITFAPLQGRANEDFLFAARGSELVLYDTHASSAPLARCRPLPLASRIHAIVPSNVDDSFFVFGGRIVAKVQFESTHFQIIAQKELTEWIFDVHPLDNDRICVALGHGLISILDAHTFEVQHSFPPSRREMSWSGVIRRLHDPNFISAHGTSFGHIIIRYLSSSTTSTVNFPAQKLEGHVGAVTILRFSKDALLLASASVDRTVRVWKCSSIGEEYGPLLTHFGHLARVWDVKFLSDDASVVSVGEDRFARLWSSTTDSEEIAAYPSHEGKNVWCVDVLRGKYLATGGDDGAIKVRTITKESENNPPKSALVECALPNDCENPRKSSVRDEGVRSMLYDDAYENQYLYLGTDFGRILRYQAPKFKEVYRDNDGIGFAPNTLAIAGNVLFAGQTNGKVLAISLLNEKEFVRFSGNGANKQMVLGLYAFESKYDDLIHVFVVSPNGDAKHWTLTDDFQPLYMGIYGHEVIRKNMLVTSAVLLNGEVLLTGDRGGRISVYNIAKDNDCDTPRRPVCFCRPHSDRVTELTIISEDELISTGFDGRVARMKLKVMDQEPSIQVGSVQRCCERIDTIFRVFIPKQDSSSSSIYERACLVGFRSTDIVFWDLEERNELYRRDCGNWKRAFDMSVQLSVGRDGKLHVENHRFAFWRAGKLFVEERGNMKSSHVQTIGTPFHGQRVNAMALIPDDGNDGDEIVYAITASEDTFVRVMQYANGHWKQLQILSGHVSGVYGISGTRSWNTKKKLAFSVGGCDEMILWGADNPHGPWKKIGYFHGTESKRRQKKLQVDEGIANHRILCVDCLPVIASDGCVFACFGRTDGSLNLVRCTESNDIWKMDIVSSVSGNAGAVMSVSHNLNGETVVVVSGDSAGYICVWEIDLSEECDKRTLRMTYKTLVHPGGVLSICLRGNVCVSGGDDGRIVAFNIADEGKMSESLVSAGSISGIVMHKNGDIVAVGMCQGVWILRILDDFRLESKKKLISDVCDPGGIAATDDGVIVCGHGLEFKRNVF